jgi:choline-phosphate cytidylyltransferase
MTEPPHLLPEDDIRAFVRRAVEGRGIEDGVVRNWKTNEPPHDRPVRIYADGVYDLFHFGHALQLRQAKLSFTNVHLLVGVCSDDLCAEHKSAPAMTHAERCEGVKHCRWADEVVPDAPWQIDQDFIDRYRIDYVAHDEMVYPTKGVVDVYDFVKKQGESLFLPPAPYLS